jgi:4-amino-4-deoxy-L-arabinose transferase-like glycosyltransferase
VPARARLRRSPAARTALLAAVRAVAGESILALRILPALAAGAAVLTTGTLARDCGGGPFAVRLAALCVACMPVTMVVGSFYSMNAFELLGWALASLYVLRIARGGSGRLWLAVGLVIGVSFLLKHTIVIFVAGLAAGVIATPLRRELGTRWPWLGAGVALAVALPNLIASPARLRFARVLSRSNRRQNIAPPLGV